MYKLPLLILLGPKKWVGIFVDGSLLLEEDTTSPLMYFTVGVEDYR